MTATWRTSSACQSATFAAASYLSDPDTVIAAVLQATTMEQIEAEQAAELEAQGLTPVDTDEGDDAGETGGSESAPDSE